jgi:hypothetical protein
MLHQGGRSVGCSGNGNLSPDGENWSHFECIYLHISAEQHRISFTSGRNNTRGWRIEGVMSLRLLMHCIIPCSCMGVSLPLVRGDRCRSRRIARILESDRCLNNGRFPLIASRIWDSPRQTFREDLTGPSKSPCFNFSTHE